MKQHRQYDPRLRLTVVKHDRVRELNRALVRYADAMGTRQHRNARRKYAIAWRRVYGVA